MDPNENMENEKTWKNLYKSEEQWTEQFTKLHGQGEEVFDRQRKNYGNIETVEIYEEEINVKRIPADWKEKLLRILVKIDRKK